ncbi:MAG: AAA family ATPase, partial [Gammaproteobacteria bacterium]|nr:AAA family ATPase [Gammaproteobacteria bacterium]
MQNQQTLQQLRTLKLIGMADALEQQQTQPATHDEL